MDWIRFLEENRIDYVTRGPNTKKGEVSIQCPMCGADDPSQHLGINIDNGNWGCHRNSSHRGKSPRTLIKAMLGCSSLHAGFVVKQYSKADPDNLDAALAALISDEARDDMMTKRDNQNNEPEFDDFNEIKPQGVTKRFFTYLRTRGYDNPYEIIERYKLRCALTGKYKDRIIIPLFFRGEVLGWTARALGSPVDAPRYLESSVELKTAVWNYDTLKKGGGRLFVVEGPFDALRIDDFGHRHKETNFVQVRATCTFGTSSTVSQKALLRSLVKHFDETFVLYDNGADHQGADLANWLGVKQAFLPEGYDDPGDLETSHLSHMLTSTYSGRTWGLSGLLRATLLIESSRLAEGVLRNNVLLQRLARKT